MLDVLEPGSVIHVHAIVLWCATAVGKHMTDDHYLMRSKKLHRDEDIVMDRLRSMLTLAYYTVLKKFVEQDPMDSGMLSMTDFVVRSFTGFSIAVCVSVGWGVCTAEA
eukprot:scpid104089/ scgid3184/ 